MMKIVWRPHLLFTDPGHLLAEESGLQESLVLARPDDGANVGGGADLAGLVSDVDAPHGGHVVDVVVPRSRVGPARLLNDQTRGLEM